jgi:hypothetical protein
VFLQLFLKRNDQWSLQILIKTEKGSASRKWTLEAWFSVKFRRRRKTWKKRFLGAIMLEKSAFDTVIEILKPECFYVDAHQRIYKAMQSLASKACR